VDRNHRPDENLLCRVQADSQATVREPVHKGDSEMKQDHADRVTHRFAATAEGAFPCEHDVASSSTVVFNLLWTGFVNYVERRFGSAPETCEACGSDYLADTFFAGLRPEAQRYFLRARAGCTE